MRIFFARYIPIIVSLLSNTLTDCDNKGKEFEEYEAESNEINDITQLFLRYRRCVAAAAKELLLCVTFVISPLSQIYIEFHRALHRQTLMFVRFLITRRLRLHSRHNAIRGGPATAV